MSLSMALPLTLIGAFSFSHTTYMSCGRGDVRTETTDAIEVGLPIEKCSWRVQRTVLEPFLDHLLMTLILSLILTLKPVDGQDR